MPAARDNELRILWSRSPPSMRGGARGQIARRVSTSRCRHRAKTAAAGSTWLCLLHVNF